jgi:4-amino-4-deoxy-L-arabinose transferase-like glycosyltransferase
MSPLPPRTTHRALVALIAAVAVTFLFARLGQRYLWQDEAQTALISRTVLEHGVPLGSDGRNFFSQEAGAEYGAHYLWRWHTWLPFYVTAASFRVLGVTTLAARLPSALFGLATIALLYRYALATFRERKVALVAAALLTLCVPFVLLSRQCRYYASAAFFSLLGLYFYAGLRAGRRWALAGLVAAATLLFHVHYIYCTTLLLTLLVHSAWRERAIFRRVFGACACVTMLTSPWVIWLMGIKYQERYGGDWFRVGTVWRNMRGFLEALAIGVLPWPFLVALAIVLLVVRRRRDPAAAPLDWGPRPECEVLLLYFAVTLAALSPTSPYPFFRYLAPLLPVICLLLVRPLALARMAHPLVGPALFALLVLTGPLPDFLYELTHEYSGPVAGMVRYLQRHARPGETVAITYEDLPLAFHTDLRVVGGLTGQDLTPGRTAEWVVLRRNILGEVDGAVAADLKRHVAWQDYERIELDAPDSLFDNREAIRDPLEGLAAEPRHPFRTPTDVPRLVIFHRIR